MCLKLGCWRILSANILHCLSMIEICLWFFLQSWVTLIWNMQLKLSPLGPLILTPLYENISWQLMRRSLLYQLLEVFFVIFFFIHFYSCAWAMHSIDLLVPCKMFAHEWCCLSIFNLCGPFTELWRFLSRPRWKTDRFQWNGMIQ